MVISLYRFREKVAEKLIFTNIISGFPKSKLFLFGLSVVCHVCKVPLNEDTPTNV